jgi:3-phenylpropionate/trans-cinnamate dioxygenase ferredoxin subunit
VSFERACALTEVPDPGAKRVELSGTAVAVVRDDDGHIHAVEDTCTHGAVSLSEGEVEGCVIECWLHGSQFDLTTGIPRTPPATAALLVFPVRIEGEDVFVDVAAPTNGPTR